MRNSTITRVIAGIGRISPTIRNTPEVKQMMRQLLPTHHEPKRVTYVPPKPNWNKQKAKTKK
jgi:hypothetical protein